MKFATENPPHHLETHSNKSAFSLSTILGHRSTFLLNVINEYYFLLPNVLKTMQPSGEFHSGMANCHISTQSRT